MPSKELVPQPFRIVILVFLLLILVAVDRDELIGTYHEVKGRLSLDKESFKSRLLSDFFNEKTSIHAVVVLPKNSDAYRGTRLPIMYHFAGFGADMGDLWDDAEQLQEMMARNPSLTMAHVFVDATLEGGYSYFTDSANNGPWESALVTEFIPSLEGKLSATFIPGKRYLTGHSSGGWTALWLQLHNPRFFSGVWASSPDPIDFSDFYGIDIRPGSTDNMYTDSDGKPRPAARTNIVGFATLKEYIAADEEDEDERGDIPSYEWAFSSKGPEGKPVPLFDRKSGALIPQTLVDWERFDLKKVLEHALADYHADLNGKIHLFVGSHDDFFLDRPTKLFCNYVASVDLATTCLIVPERSHRNLYAPHQQLYPHGLMARILTEASEQAR